MTTADIFAVHRRAWTAKRALRLYYRREIFARILHELRPGPILELGVGPGFFAETNPGMVGLDILAGHAGDVTGDAHALPFADGVFANVIGVDVLHHLARPGQALAETARVLRPGGRLVLVEPWTGPVGRLFYRYLHHEDCAPVTDPWSAAFAPGKDAMDGNAMIPWMLLHRRRDELRAYAPFDPVLCRPFGALSYAATGGFQPFGLPWPIVAGLCRLERVLPAVVRETIALRALFVLDRAAA